MEEKKDFLSHINGKKEEKKAESFKEETFEYQKKSYTQYLIPSILVLLLTFAAFFYLNQKTEMIDMTYMTLEEANLWAKDQGLILKATYVYDDQIEANQIIDQDIEVGKKMDQNASITVRVSQGYDPYLAVAIPAFDSTWSRNSILNWIKENNIENYSFLTQKTDTVPEDYLISYRLIGVDGSNFNRSSEIEFITNEVAETIVVEMESFIGDSLSSVDIWAKNNDVLYTYSYQASDIYEADKIISQSVTSASNLNIDEVVHFIVSTGQEGTIEMENLLNTSIVSADVWLKSHRIAYSLTYKYSDIYSKDTVMDSNFYEGEIISGPVELVVSLGEATLVENFENMTSYEAEAYANTYSQVTYKEVYMSDSNKGDFVSQSLSAGSYMDDDSELEITYSLGSKVAVEDFRNQSILDLEEWVYEQNQIGAHITLTINEEADPLVDAGHIVTQEVYNGYIPMTGTLKVSVSEGLTVPWFRDMTIAEVERFADQSMLDVNIVEMYHEKYEQGQYIMQSIHGGIKADSNTLVDVYFSLGNSLAIKDFSNQAISEMMTWVQEQNGLDADLSIEIREQYNSEVDYGKIISQSVSNVYEPIDTTIYVIVSKGEAVTVPNYSYYTEESIVASADAMNLTVVFEYVQTEDYPAGRVISQTPQAGEEMSKSDYIIIEIAE